MANDNDMVVRQVGLTFALLASPAKRDVAWVQANVDGYGGRTRDAATHLIERDVRELRDLGVPARYQDGEVWVVKDLYELPPEEAKEIPQAPTSLEAALVALERDHDFLTEGDVFTEDLIESYIKLKYDREITPSRLHPTPLEFEMYYDC